MSKGIPRAALVGTRPSHSQVSSDLAEQRLQVTRLGSLGSGSNNYLGGLSLATSTVSNSSLKKPKIEINKQG